MAASRMSRIANCKLAISLCLVTTLTYALSARVSADNSEDAEIISAPRSGNEFVAYTIVDDDEVGIVTSSPDLKKHTLNKKSHQKHYPKTEADWNFKEEGKKTDIFIKDAKDNRLLRIISEGLLNPQDALPILSNDAITSSQKNDSNEEINVNIESEGMSGIMNDGLTVDSAERLIMERKINATKGKTFAKTETDSNSKESEENVKINLDANAGVRKPVFNNKQKDSIAVPPQKQISLSKGKESHHNFKKPIASGYDVVTVNKPFVFDKLKNADDGVFDFVDSSLSDKHLVPASTAQTSRINVKKGPNGQDYEYEYIYYYYEDESDAAIQNNGGGDKVFKANEIPVSTNAPPTAKTTSPMLRSSSTSPTLRSSSTPSSRNTKPFATDDGLGTRFKSADVLHEEVTIQPQQNRDKFRYPVDNSLAHPTPSKNSESNELYNQPQYNSARYPGRQVLPQTISVQPIVTTSEEPRQTSTKQASRGRTHYNTITDDTSAADTTLPISTQQTKSKFTTGSVRQPGLELVDNNSFRTHSTVVPIDYEKVYSPSQTLENQSNTAQSQTYIITSSTKSGELFRKDPTVEYITDAVRTTAAPARSVQFHSSNQPTETIVDNTAPFSTLSENSLTTVYGAGLTDKAAHDLYAIYQQTRNEEARNFGSPDDRSVVDDSENTYAPTNPTVASVFSASTAAATTTTVAPSPTTTTASPISSISPGRNRFRSSSTGTRSKASYSTTTESSTIASSAESTHSEGTEKPQRSKFQPSHRRDPGKVSAYGRRGSTTTVASEQESSSVSPKEREAKPSSSSGPSKRYRGGNVRPETGSTTESQPTSASSHPRPNFADRYNSRRRQGGLKSTTTTASTDEEGAVKQDSAEANIPEQQSTTFRSVRNKLNQNSQVRPLRPGPKLNLSSRGKHASTTSTTTTSAPIDTELNGSADEPVEQKPSEDNFEYEELSPEINTTPSTTTVSTQPPGTLTRLKNRPRLRVSEKGNHAKMQAQQSNNSVAVNQNRRQLINNLIPRKKQPTSTTEAQELLTEEKLDVSKPITEELIEEPAPKSDADVSETIPLAEVSSTTESKLNSLLASRRRNRKPGTLHNRQTANENR